MHDSFSDDRILDRDWRLPGCTSVCRRVRALVIGEGMTRYVEIHDPIAHEDYGMGIAVPGKVRGDVVRTGGITINPRTHDVQVNGRPIHLTPLESQLLLCLSDHLGALMERQRVVDIVWRGEMSPRMSSDEPYHFLRMLSWRLRQKLHPCDDLIETVPGVGIKLLTCPPDEQYNSGTTPRQWARHYAACIDCGGTGRAHVGHGRCSMCFHRHRRNNGLT